MRIAPFILAFALAACSNSEFAGSNASPAKKTKKPEKQSEPVDDPEPKTDDKIDDDKDDDTDNDGANAKKNDGDLGEDGEVKDVDLPLQFQAFQGDAADTNCIAIQVNGQPEVQMGCNIGANQFANQTLKAKSKPFCNVIRMIDHDTTSGATISTQNAAQVRWGGDQTLVNFLGMRVFEPAAGTVKGDINDNGDDNPLVDVSFQVSGLSAINYTVENTGQGCKPKAP